MYYCSSPNVSASLLISDLSVNYSDSSPDTPFFIIPVDFLKILGVTFLPAPKAELPVFLDKKLYRPDPSNGLANLPEPLGIPNPPLSLAISSIPPDVPLPALPKPPALKFMAFFFSSLISPCIFCNLAIYFFTSLNSLRFSCSLSRRLKRSEGVYFSAIFLAFSLCTSHLELISFSKSGFYS